MRDSASRESIINMMMVMVMMRLALLAIYEGNGYKSGVKYAAMDDEITNDTVHLFFEMMSCIFQQI